MIRSLDRWFPGYVRSVMNRPGRVDGPEHLMFCLADHFEPFRGNAERSDAVGIVRRWVDKYPATFSEYRDSDGKMPRHTFFYPQEEYDAECVDLLAGFCRNGHGEVEVHLHHRNDTRDGLAEKLTVFRDTLRGRHGLLGSDSEGNPRYGFVHGNWALCNSRPDGDWCGVDEEIGVLRETGCYADFTFPSAPSPTQPRMVNVIYRADDRKNGNGCNEGKEVGSQKSEVGNERDEHSTLKYRREPRTSLTINHQPSTILHPSLMLITGPLGLDWRRRKWGVLPRIENGAITPANPPVSSRIRLWVRQHIHVVGRPEWVFVKVYTHGCVGENMEVLLGDRMRKAHECLQSEFNDGQKWVLHYVAAREMYNIVRAAEDGKAGNPGDFRDYEISKPTFEK